MQEKIPSKKMLARQEKIKAVAYEFFLTKGYQETSLSDIIKVSGGSYSNIYTTFKNKEGLFFEILNDVCKKHFALISSKIQAIKSNNLEEILYSFGIAFVEIFNDPQAIAFGKVIYSQVYEKDKQLNFWIKSNQDNFAYNILAQYFEKEDNKFLKQNSKKLAELFCTMLKEPYYNLNVLADTPMMDTKQQQEHVKFIVKIFINGIKK